MKLCRFKRSDGQTGIGLVMQDFVIDLEPSGVRTIESLLEASKFPDLERLPAGSFERLPLGEVRLLPPIELQEVWAAGVTYLRSKTARMEESNFSASAYDRVYEASRPELFFKSLPAKVIGPFGKVGIRRDARWNVPEPELALVLNSAGQVRGYTIGNDMSSRDIEGENALYLPQAKVYQGSCAVGPWILVGPSEAEARTWRINLEIRRGAQLAFAGETSVGQIKRSFEELAGYLYRSQQFPHGTVLLTGTGIVPPDDFTLAVGDTVRISISGIGVLENQVEQV